ncbi:type III polyketide synthase [Marisediminicola sp. LYQ134]|uniref:type III polyketide synthase n=1 Tax=Marisediminicola sp. LYQ134 TaxID=3391061 RepID=UPI003983CE22
MTSRRSHQCGPVWRPAQWAALPRAEGWCRSARNRVLPSRMARIAAVATALPEHVYPQAEITETIGSIVTRDRSKRAVLDRLHQSSRVDTRHLVMPLERYLDPQTFTQSNDMFIEIAADLAERSLREALATAGLEPADVDYVMFTSVTGISAPSIDALLVARLGLRSDVKRVPMYGLGCVAGAAGIARVADYLVGHPDDVGVLVSVELCSLTFQRDDESTANLVATGLFGDGAASVVMVGSDRAERMSAAGPDVVDTRSRIYPDTEEVIGFNASETGFRIILTPRVSEVVEEHFGDDVRAFLADNGSAVDEVAGWIAHPGGPRVLETFASALDLTDDELAISWRSLARVGNLSSASVLHILADSIDELDPSPGDRTVLFALGPGISAELVLLEWPA